MKALTLRSTLLVLTTVISTVLLSGCDDTDNFQVATELEPPSTVVSSSINNGDNANLEADSIDHTLTDITVANLLESILVPLRTNQLIDDKQQACINNLDENFAKSEVQKFFMKNFTSKELTALNEFYKSDVAQAYTNYGREQLLISSGLDVKKASKRPNEEAIHAIQKFSTSDLGEKYIDMMQEVGENSLTNIVMPLLMQEMVKCGVPL